MKMRASSIDVLASKEICLPTLTIIIEVIIQLHFVEYK